MGYLPINRTFNTGLLLVALAALGYWGWTTQVGFLRIIVSTSLPAVSAGIWYLFRAIEPVQLKPIPVVVPGKVRLVLEVIILAGAVAALAAANSLFWAIIFGLAVGLHYLTSIDRISWLISPG